MANALTLDVQKTDTVASVVRMTFAMTVWVCKTRGASGWLTP